MMQRSFLAVALLLFFIPSGLWACTCSKEPPGKCPGLQSDDVVFLGTVTEIAAVAPDATSAEAASAAASTDEANPGVAPQTASPITRYHFHIDEKFAGPDSPDVDVFSGGDDGDCGYYFKKGEQYIVFTQQETEGRLFAVVCGQTRPASEGRALLLNCVPCGTTIASLPSSACCAEPILRSSPLPTIPKTPSRT